ALLLLGTVKNGGITHTAGAHPWLEMDSSRRLAAISRDGERLETLHKHAQGRMNGCALHTTGAGRVVSLLRSRCPAHALAEPRCYCLRLQKSSRYRRSMNHQALSSFIWSVA